MKRILFLIFFAVIGWIQSFSQTFDQNYIMSCVYNYNTSNGTDSIKSIQYYDGLGRPVQTVQKGITPQGDDLVTLTEYDEVGREYKHWLPKTNNGSGAFVPVGTFKDIGEPLYNGDSRPFSETIYEPSALNRVTAQKGPGAAWESHPITTSYQTNAGNEVKQFVLSGTKSISYTGYYSAATLYKTETADEDGKTTTEYKDKLGRVVMQRQSSNVDTYYIYNDLGQLAIVLPPLAADANGSNDAINKYAYVYQYDERGNCIYKKLPGCEPIWMVYDKADRLVLSQDGNQRPKGNWIVNKYDMLGRVLYTSEVTAGGDLLGMVNAFKNWIILETFSTGGQVYPQEDTGYSKGWYHEAPTKLLTVNYYDDYRFLELPAMAPHKAKLTYQAKDGYSKQYSSAKGLLTGTRTYLLDNSGTYTTTAYYYDERGNIVQERSTNYLGGYDITYHNLDFTGNPKETLIEHNVPGVSSNELYKYTYDHAGRLTTTTYKLDNADEIALSTVSYDELGRAVQKLRHNGTDTEKYKYNIRGWTTEIESGSFSQSLFYNGSLPPATEACYNGNIAYMQWNYGDKHYSYRYRYDELNRLKEAITSVTISNPRDRTNAEYFSYDKHGNIEHIFRFRTQGMVLDNLYFNYNNSNQVQSIDDYSSGQYQYGLKEYQNLANFEQEMRYDANGNLIMDLDRDILTIQYNLLNLPDVILFRNGNQIRNLYDASGTKLRSMTLINPLPTQAPIFLTEEQFQEACGWLQATGYIKNREYTLFNWGGEFTWGMDNRLVKTYNPEGYKAGRGMHYYRRDHLGSIREVWRTAYTVGSTTYPDTTLQRTQYYPSGLPWAEGEGSNEQQRKYNGKEWIEAHGLDEYDYHARGYYPAILRFTTMDPLAEKKPWLTPYHYCGNNPIMRVDPTGMDWVENNETGNITWNKNATSADNTPEGFTYRGITYAREKEWNNNKYVGKVVEVYRPDGSGLDYYTPNEYGMYRVPESGRGFERYMKSDGTSSGNNENYTVNGKLHTGDNYASSATFVSFYNTIQDFHSETGVTIHYGDISAYDPSINLGHSTHYTGNSIDIHYFGSKGEELRGANAYMKADVSLTNTFFEHAQNNGFSKNYSFGNRFTHKGNNNQKLHKDHLHIGR
ncbi:MAG TPA: hypothetical protein GXZ87_03435 [Bacteroidales bacterium]|nr:hypothetical protein [Bacteroidales bacterium]